MSLLERARSLGIVKTEEDKKTAALIERLERETGAKILVIRSDGDLRLELLEVPKGARGQGLGSHIMESLVTHADERGLRMRLTPALRDTRHGTTSRGRLVRFYRRFGFIENKGRGKDFTLGAGEMYREPKKRRGLSTSSDLTVFDDPRGPKSLSPEKAARLKSAGLITFERGGWVLTKKGLEAMTERSKGRAGGRRRGLSFGMDDFDLADDDAKVDALSTAPVERALGGEMGSMLDASRLLKPEGLQLIEPAAIWHYFRSRAWAVKAPSASAKTVARIAAKIRKNLVSKRALTASDPYMHDLRLFVIYPGGVHDEGAPSAGRAGGSSDPLRALEEDGSFVEGRKKSHGRAGGSSKHSVTLYDAGGTAIRKVGASSAADAERIAKNLSADYEGMGAFALAEPRT